jgi:hypothetical protein
VRARGGGPVFINGRRVSLARGRHWTHWHGRRRYFVPLAALGLLTVGAVAYSAYAYAPVEGPYCAGTTEDGCLLQWREVPTPEGDLIPQCVVYCPQ